jgi:bacterial/archaeal transporter family-2 protein
VIAVMTKGAGMSTLLVVAIMGLLGGIAVGLQGPLSSLMSDRIGLMESIFIIHIGGAILIGVPLLARGGGNLGAWRSVPWYALLAGGFGLIVITAVSYAIPRIGVAATVTLIVAGQLLVSAAADQFGWLGADTRPLDPTRAVGILVLFVGVWLIVRK